MSSIIDFFNRGGYYLLMGIIMIIFLMAIQKSLWFLCYLETHCHQQYLEMTIDN